MTIIVTALPENKEPLGPIETLSLTWHERSKTRSRHKTNRGRDIAISLPRGTMLFDDTVLHNCSEVTVIVKARPEDVLVIFPASQAEYCKVAHHLGNWHRSIEVGAGGQIVAEWDSPLADWLQRSDIKWEATSSPFEPDLRCAGHD